MYQNTKLFILLQYFHNSTILQYFYLNIICILFYSIYTCLDEHKTFFFKKAWHYETYLYLHSYLIPILL